MMAKLYWRVKQNGKWTWRPAQVIKSMSTYRRTAVWNFGFEMEEEE